MIYRNGQDNKDRGEYVGQGYEDGDKIVAYEKNGFIHVYQDIVRIGEYPSDNFTVMEALYLAAAGCSYAADHGDLESTDYENLDHTDLVDIDIVGDSEQYQYNL